MNPPPVQQKGGAWSDGMKGEWGEESGGFRVASRITPQLDYFASVAFVALMIASRGRCGILDAGCRSVAQPGRALGLGPRRRRFKSCRSDHSIIEIGRAHVGPKDE